MFGGLIQYRGSVIGLEQRSDGGATLRLYCGGLAKEKAEVKD